MGNSSDEFAEGQAKKRRELRTLSNLEAVFGHLTVERQSELSELITCDLELFGDTLRQTHLVEHDMDVVDTQPIRQRIYRVSEGKHKVVESEKVYA